MQSVRISVVPAVGVALTLVSSLTSPAAAQIAVGAKFVSSVNVVSGESLTSPGDYRGRFGQCYAIVPYNPNTTNMPEDQVGPGLARSNADRYLVNGLPAQCVSGSLAPLVDFEVRTDNEPAQSPTEAPPYIPNEAFVWHYCEPTDAECDLPAWRVKPGVSQYNQCLSAAANTDVFYNGVWDDELFGPLSLNLDIAKGGDATIAYYFVEGVGECRTLEYELSVWTGSSWSLEATGRIGRFEDGQYLVFTLNGLPQPQPGLVNVVQFKVKPATTFDKGCSTGGPNLIIGGAFIDGPICAPAKPSIDIRKQIEGPDERTVASGATVPFEIVVTNTGDVTLSNVVVSDAKTPGCGKMIGTLAPQASVTYTCSAPTVTLGFTNTACVTGAAEGTTVKDCDDSTVKVKVTNPGTGTPGYWKNHPEAWPTGGVSVCGVTYTYANAVKYFNDDSDKTYTMFRALVASQLNVAIGNSASCIADVITAADAWMCKYGPVGSGVSGRSTAWKAGEPLSLTLDAYNNGRLCAPARR